MKNKPGFTIVELLIVIVVIGILAAIVIVAYNGVQTRARDSQRASDMAHIKKSLLMYNSVNGGVQATYTFGGNGIGGWNYSAGSNWLSFLDSEYGKMPVDPLNINPETGSSDFSYIYFCYSPGGSYPEPTVVLGYWTEANPRHVIERFVVDRCI